MHVRSWRAAYVGLLPDDFLARLSAEERASSWEQRIAEGAGQVLVLEEDSVVAGFAAFGPSQLYALYLLPEFWGRGLGRALHDRVVEGMSGDGAVLWVLAANERAKAFYARQGWQPDGATGTEALGDVTLEVVRFRRPLP